MKFKEFSKIINKKFVDMSKGELYVVQQDRNTIWDVYLESYPEGTNNTYKERREHDCQNCKQFIRNIGGVISISADMTLDTIWNVEGLSGEYMVVAEALHEFVGGLPIANAFLKQEHKYGLLSNVQVTDLGSITWDHFHADVPQKFYNQFPDTKLGEIRTNKELLERGVNELTIEAFETVLELIAQDGIYRGAEHKQAIANFLKLRLEFNTTGNKEVWLWSKANDPAVRFKNTVIGTLIQDISEGVELERAVASFESKVAPANYKRSSAIITKGMVDKAMATINELGIEPALHRRYAELSDISVNNVLFADRSIKPIMKDSIADILGSAVKSKPQDYSKVDEVSIEDLMAMLPTIQSMGVLLEGKHSANLCSLIAPKYEAKNILKWSNNFSWAYNGGVTDSIKENVKNAGGNVEGFLRISLSWTNNDDLDLHCLTAEGKTIFFGDKKPQGTKGQLDVDMMSGGTPQKPCIENIYWVNQMDLANGDYKIMVHNYFKRTTADQGYTVQVEYNGNTVNYTSDNNPGQNVKDHIVTISYNNGDFKFSEKGTLGSSKEIYGVKTNEFHKVSVMALSPNFWDDQEIGNKHYMFFLDGCKNDEPIQGLYNEFLNNELNPHRKVFEVLGSKLKCEQSDNQLSGLGFSSTKRDSLIIKVTGAFTRTLKVNF